MPANAPSAAIETMDRAPAQAPHSICMYDMASEPQVEAEPERAARREWRHVDVSGDGLVAEVADLGIQTLVLAST